MGPSAARRAGWLGRWLGVGLCAVLGAGARAEAPPSPCAGEVAGLAFLEGRWVAPSPTGFTEERWSAPAGGTVMGQGRVVEGGRTLFFEHLLVRAGPGGCPELVAWPQGGAPVAFALVRLQGQEAVFEAPGHDWPQRIRYARVGDALTASAADLAGQRSSTSLLRRAP